MGFEIFMAGNTKVKVCWDVMVIRFWIKLLLPSSG